MSETQPSIERLRIAIANAANALYSGHAGEEASNRAIDLTEAWDAAASDLAAMRAVVEAAPKDKNGKPMAVGMTVKVTGYDMGGYLDGDTQPPGRIVSVCKDHVWVAWDDGACDQTTFDDHQCEIVDAAARPAEQPKGEGQGNG